MQAQTKLAHSLDRAKLALANRPHAPGEKWLALASGVGVWLATRGHASLAVRLAGTLAGTLIVTHTVAGRQGLEKITRHLPFRDRFGN